MSILDEFVTELRTFFDRVEAEVRTRLTPVQAAPDAPAEVAADPLAADPPPPVEPPAEPAPPAETEQPTQVHLPG